jgi:hypothetical protein
VLAGEGPGEDVSKGVPARPVVAARKVRREREREEQRKLFFLRKGAEEAD